MEKLLGYKPFHFLLFLVLGICFQFYTDYWNFGIVISFCILIFLFFIGYCLSNTSFFIFFIWLLFFLGGIVLVYSGDLRNDEHYFDKHLTIQSSVILQIKNILKPGNYHQKYIAEVIQVDHKKTTGIVLLNLEKDSISVNFEVDDRVLLKNKFVLINEPQNPHQFNYNEYLEKKGIYKQVYSNKMEVLLLESNSSSLLGLIHKIRLKIQKSLNQYSFSQDELAIMNAMLLGQRQEISKELADNYSKAGAIHILAISGLHVGVILWILSFVFKPVEIFRKGKIIKLVFIIFFLWLFALLAGMSGSILRAVTMFSAIAIGQFFNKRNAIEQSLIFSMFIILLWKPLFLFDVGFQLSYLAVFGIIWVHPMLNKLWKPRFYILKKVWQIITVSSAAQLAVLPISLFYFHQFPGLFFISNLFIIPFLGIILITGIIVLILSSLTILPESLAEVYGEIISSLNYIVGFIAKQEAFLFSAISFSSLLLISSYFLLILGFQFLIKRNVRWLMLFLITILIFQCVLIYEKYIIENKYEFIIFHKTRNTVVAQRISNKLKVFHDMDSLIITKQFFLNNYKIGEKIQLRIHNNLPRLFSLNNQPILIVDNEGIYKIKTLQRPIIILKQSPKINLERLIGKLQPLIIIADGSNYTGTVRQWKKTCLRTEIPFWSTKEKGAFIFRREKN